MRALRNFESSFVLSLCCTAPGTPLIVDTKPSIHCYFLGLYSILKTHQLLSSLVPDPPLLIHLGFLSPVFLELCLLSVQF